MHFPSQINPGLSTNQTFLFKRKKLVTFPILGPGLLFIRTIFLFSYGYMVYFTLLEVKVWKEFFSYFFEKINLEGGVAIYLVRKEDYFWGGWN